MKICCSSWSQRHIRSPPWMDVIKMQDIKAVTILYPYYRSTFGGQRWPTRCSNPSGPAPTAYSMKVASPMALLHPIMAIAPLDLLHVDFTSIETTLEPTQSPRVANVLVLQGHCMKHVLAYVTPTPTAKTIAKFLYHGYISIFGPWPRLPEW